MPISLLQVISQSESHHAIKPSITMGSYTGVVQTPVQPSTLGVVGAARHGVGPCSPHHRTKGVGGGTLPGLLLCQRQPQLASQPEGCSHPRLKHALQ